LAAASKGVFNRVLTETVLTLWNNNTSVQREPSRSRRGALKVNAVLNKLLKASAATRFHREKCDERTGRMLVFLVRAS